MSEPVSNSEQHGPEVKAPYISLTAQVLPSSALAEFVIRRGGDADWSEVIAHLQTQRADYRHQSLDPLGLRTPLFGLPFGWSSNSE